MLFAVLITFELVSNTLTNLMLFNCRTNNVSGEWKWISCNGDGDSKGLAPYIQQDDPAKYYSPRG